MEYDHRSSSYPDLLPEQAEEQREHFERERTRERKNVAVELLSVGEALRDMEE
jgi:hypothetical protein